MGLLKSASSKKAALFLGGALLVSGSLFAVACGTDNGNVDDGQLPTPEAGRDARTGDGGTDPGDGSTPITDGASSVDCGEVPRLTNNAQGFYCPFKDRDAGDGGRLSSNCASTETCCAPNRVGADFPPSFCASSKADNACPNQAADYNSTWSAGGNLWQCGDKRNCPGANAVCCMTTRPDAGTNKFNVGPAFNGDFPKSCGVLEGFQAGGTLCRQNACTAGTETAVCAADADCPTGQKCTPFFINAGNRYFGYCR